VLQSKFAKMMMVFAYTNILVDCDWSEICLLNWVKRKRNT